MFLNGQKTSDTNRKNFSTAESVSPKAIGRVTPSPNIIIQRLKEGEDIPSLEEQTRKHLLAKSHNKEDADTFLETNKNVKIKSTLDEENKLLLTNALKKTVIYKALTGSVSKGMALFENQLHSKVGQNASMGTQISTEHVDKYQNNEYVSADVYGDFESAKKTLGKEDFKPSSVSKWKDGKTLFSNFKMAPDEEMGYVALGDDGGNAHEENLKKAQETISTMIEPQVLITVPAPKVIIHKQLEGEPGFRAYQGGTEIHIASDDAVETIVHEVGHYLESNLGSKLYHDVGVLREKRHSDAVGYSFFGGRKAGKIEDDEGETDDDYKGRYKGDYAATGAYTAKVYEGHGATEVVSLTMEYLANPQKAKTLVEKDPLQAIIILRRIRPSDSEIQKIAAVIKDYLPN